MEYYTKLQIFFHHTKELWAVILGMFVQYWFGDVKSRRIVITIIISTIVVAVYFVPMVIEILNMVLLKMASLKITPDSKIAIALYAFSTIISVDILAIIINILPKGLNRQAKKYLGIKDAKNNEQ